MQAIGGQLDVGLDHHFAGCQIDYIGSSQCAIQLGGFHFDLLNSRCAQRLQRAGCDFASGVRNLFALVQYRMRRLGAHQVSGHMRILRDRPLQLAVGDVQPVHGIEGLQNLFVRTQPQRAQEDGAQELALAVDAHVEGVLLVILKLHPRTAVGNDLAQEVGAIVGGLKEDAG